MDDPLTENNHLQLEMDRTHEEAGGLAICSGGTAVVAPGDMGAQRDLLLSVAEIQSKNLKRLYWNGVGVTVMYMVLGMGWFMISDGWSFTNTVFFSVTSLLTVGYGDIVPKNEGEDRFTDSLLIVLGLITLGVWGAYGQERSIRAKHLKAAEERHLTLRFDADRNTRECYRDLVASLVKAVVIIFIGVVAFMIGEETYFTTSFYWAIVTASTIGYGDVVPTTDVMKWFTTFFSIAASIAMLVMLQTVGEFPFRLWSIRAEAEVIAQFAPPKSPEGKARVTALLKTAVTEKLGMPSDRTQRQIITRSDFTLSMLLMLDRISYTDYVEIARVFDDLGIAQEGEIHAAPSRVFQKR